MDTQLPAGTTDAAAPIGAGTEHLTIGSRIARVFGVLVAPVSTLQAIARKPSWAAPLILWIVMAGFTSVVITPRLDMEHAIRQRAASQGVAMSDQQVQQALAVQARFRWIGEAAAIVMPAVMAGFIALLFFGVFAAAGDKAMSYRQSFAVTTHAFVPQILAGFGTAIVAWRMDKIDPAAVGDLLCSNPACFASDTLSPAMHAALQSVDLYVIWTIILMTIGYAAAGRLSRVFTGSVVVGIWLLAVIGKVLLTGMFM